VPFPVSASSICWPRSPSWPTCSAAGARGPGYPRNLLTLCLITDRRRLLAALDLPASAWAEVLLAQLEGAIAGGIDVVQIRESEIPARDLTSLVRRCVAAGAQSRARIIVNDRIDVALSANAHGVHLREDSIAISEARRLSHREFFVGRTVHSSATAARARSADYLITGSVFETESKPGQPASLGLNGLRDVVRAAGDCPVWALGGVHPDRARDLVACGVRGVAAIGAFLPRVRTTAVASEVQKVTEVLRFSFDSAVGLS
jgi:thiamine-phosphate pyrophosphorylase